MNSYTFESGEKSQEKVLLSTCLPYIFVINCPAMKLQYSVDRRAIIFIRADSSTIRSRLESRHPKKNGGVDARQLNMFV